MNRFDCAFVAAAHYAKALRLNPKYVHILQEDHDSAYITEDGDFRYTHTPHGDTMLISISNSRLSFPEMKRRRVRWRHSTDRYEISYRWPRHRPSCKWR